METKDFRSSVSAGKRAAYRATNYRLGAGANRIVLKIGIHCPALADLFASKQVDCGAFITAFNPEGRRQSDEANDRDHLQLLGMVTEIGLNLIEGEGEGEAGDWPAERSVFVPGLDKFRACELGRRFRQDAIVWVGPDRVPELVMLR